MTIAKKDVSVNGPGFTGKTFARYRTYVTNCLDTNLESNGEILITFTEFARYWPSVIPLRFLKNFLKTSNISFLYKGCRVILFSDELKDNSSALFSVDELISFIVFGKHVKKSTFSEFKTNLNEDTCSELYLRVTEIISDYSLHTILSCTRDGNVLLLTVCDYIPVTVFPCTSENLYFFGSRSTLIELFRVLYLIALSQLSCDPKNDILLSCLKEVVADLRYPIV